MSSTRRQQPPAGRKLYLPSELEHDSLSKSSPAVLESKHTVATRATLPSIESVSVPPTPVWHCRHPAIAAYASLNVCMGSR